MTRENIFKAIEANSGEAIEESSKNGIVAHQVDVEGLIDDILKASNGDIGDVSESLCKHLWVDARNIAVGNGKLCVKCHEIRE